MAADGAIYPLTVSFDKLSMSFFPLLEAGLRIQVSAGAPRDQLRKMLKFVVTHNIRPTIMTWPMNQKGVEESMRTLREGKMRFLLLSWTIHWEDFCLSRISFRGKEFIIS